MGRIGIPPGNRLGAFPVFLENGESLENNYKNKGLGRSSLPKWILWTIEFIWVLGIPLNCHHKMISLQKHIFGTIF